MHVEVINAVASIVRHKAERMQRKATEGKWGESTADDCGSYCFAWNKCDELNVIA